MKNLVLLFLLLSTPLQTALGQNLRVLFIGNSYTYLQKLRPTLPKAIAMLAEKKGKTIEVEMEARPMMSLLTHWTIGRAVEKIRTGKWDIVVLQENAKVPLESPEDMMKAVQSFDEEIKKIGAKTFLYLTWELRQWPGTEAKLNQSYLEVANAVGAKIVPVGPAWKLYEQRFGDLEFRQPDFSSHATAPGAYLAALTFYASFFNEAPSEMYSNVFAALDLTPKQERDLEAVAWEAVSKGDHLKPSKDDRR